MSELQRLDGLVQQYEAMTQRCPSCGKPLQRQPDGTWACPEDGPAEPPQAPKAIPYSATGYWLQAVDVRLTGPIQFHRPGPCQGHGGKGGSKSKGRIKSALRQRMDACNRARFLRSRSLSGAAARVDLTKRK